MVYFQVQDKKLKFKMKKSEMQSSSLDCYSIGRESQINKKINKCKNQESQINKRKKPITWPFQAQITIHFLQYLKDIIR